MSITLSLSGNKSVLTTDYFPPIQLKEDYVCGLIDFHTYHSIPNVDQDNNLFHIGDKKLELPIGSYEFDDISEYLRIAYADVTKDVDTYININANSNTLQVELYSSKEKIYFDKERSIGQMLGFSKRVLEPGKIHRSDQSLMITQNNIVRIECSIVSASYINSTPAHTLHEFAICVAPGYKIDEIPQNMVYLPVTTRQISSITLRIVNQDGVLVNFRGENISVRLHLKPNH